MLGFHYAFPHGIIVLSEKYIYIYIFGVCCLFTLSLFHGRNSRLLIVTLDWEVRLAGSKPH